MEYSLSHEWPSHRGQALTVQAELRKRVIISGNIRQPSIIAAVETAYGHGGNDVYAAAVAMSFPELHIIERGFDHRPVNFPYVPGLFYFREGPSMIAALAKLKSDVDVLIVHGHGIAHPNGCGIASCVGLAFEKSSIGCARRLLAGQHRKVDVHKGATQSIVIDSQPVGLAYRSRNSVKPIFLSPGHLCNIEQARDIIVQCLRGYRLPEPSRIAHAAANRSRRRHERDREPVHS
jgi:deoxyribonuclease V